MTACVNKKSKRVAAVVTASLVGALSIGAPAVALAANGGIEMLAATPAQAYNQGDVSEYTIGTKTVAGNADVKIAVSDVKSSTIEITKVKPAGSDTEDVAVSSTPSKNTIFFKKVPATTPASECLIIDGVKYQWLNSMPSSVGDYVAIVKYSGTKGEDGYVETASGNTADVPTLKFSIVADSLEGAELAAKDKKTGEYTVTDFSYDGKTKWSDLKVAIAGKSTNVDFTVYVKGTDKQVGTDQILQAGDYTVIAKPTTGSYAGQSFEQDVKVSKLDLSKLGLYIEDRLASVAAPTIADVKYSDGTKFDGLLEQYDLKLTSHSIYQNNTTGTYTYELTVAEGNSDAQKLAQANVEGKAVLTFNRLAANTAVSWKYDGHDLTNVTHITVNTSESANNFTGTDWTLKSIDLSKLSGFYSDVDGKSIDLASGQYTWTIKDADGNVVNDFSKKGEYTVSVEANPSKLEYSVARSTKTFDVTVKQGTIGKADVIFTFDGAVKNDTLTQTYDGKDYLSRIGITVKDSKGNALKAGEDYRVVVKNGENKVVTEIVDAGTYTVSIESDSYDVDANNKLTVEVKKLSVTPVFDTTAAPFKTFYSYEKQSDGTVKLVANTNIPYTGSKIEGLKAGYMADLNDDGEDEFVALPDGSYTLTYKKGGKVVDGLMAAGSYKVDVNPVLSETNYTFSMETLDVVVEKNMATGFVDVKDEEWFAEALNKAKVNGYLSGRGETGMVAPTETITRADAVVVLYKMAGGSLNAGDYEYNVNKYYETGFSDVDGHAYYANAIAWAQDMDIANGSNGKFRPEDKVTREEFAALLSNYAIAKGDYEAAGDDALAGMPDASSVSPWFTDAVSWAVENGIMGNGGKISAQSNIQRAEVAAMAVNYQPGLFA